MKRKLFVSAILLLTVMVGIAFAARYEQLSVTDLVTSTIKPIATTLTVGSAATTSITLTTDDGSVTVDGSLSGVAPAGITGTPDSTGIWTFTKTAAGTATLTSADDDANAALTLAAGGTGTLTLGDTASPAILLGTTLAATTTDDMTLTVTAGSAGEDLILDQNGNVDASILLSTEGSGADAVKVETVTNGGDIIVSSVDNIQIISTTASGLIDIDGTAGLVYSIAEDDTTADDIDIGSAKDDIDIEGEDITLDTADDGNATVADDWAFTMESAGGIFSVNGTLGLVANIGTDDTTADTITIGSAKDTSAIAGIAVTVGSTGTTSAATIQSGTGDVTITSTDDLIWSGTDDVTLNGGSTGSILNLFTNNHANVLNIGTGTAGNTFNLGTDDTTADTINIGSAKDAVTMAGITSFSLPARTSSGNGAIVADKCSVVEYGEGTIHKSVVTFTLTGDHDIDCPDGGQSAGVKFFDLPEGRIYVLGATINASVVTNDAYNATANDIYYMSVGTVDGTQAADADLTSTEADIIPKTTLDTASSTSLTLDLHGALAAAAQFDGTTTPVDLYMNVAVPDASNTGATTHAVTGTLTLTWINLGDY